MKTAALIPAANDDWSLILSVPAIAPFVDEVVVLDDASIDRTPEVLTFLQKKIKNLRVHREEKSIGWIEARNALTHLTDAEGLFFIDADDIFCDWGAPDLQKIARGHQPHVRLGLLELIGDLRHGTGRGYPRPHYDRCHCYINRRVVKYLVWKHKNSYSFPSTDFPAISSGCVLFCHAKWVKSDWRLRWRSSVRSWLRKRGELRNGLEADSHEAVVDMLLHNKNNRIRRIPEEVRLPDVCLQNERFQMVYQSGSLVDRIDRGFELP